MNSHNKLFLKSAIGFLIGMFFFAVVGTVTNTGFISKLSYVLSVFGAIGFFVLIVVLIVTKAEDLEYIKNEGRKEADHRRKLEEYEARYGKRN